MLLKRLLFMFSLVGIVSSLLGFVWYQQDMMYTSNPSYVVSSSNVQPSMVIPGPTSVPPTTINTVRHSDKKYGVLVLSLPNSSQYNTDDDVFASKSATVSLDDLPAIIISNITRSEAEQIVSSLLGASYRAQVVVTKP